MPRPRVSLRTLLVWAVAAATAIALAVVGLASSGGHSGRLAPALPSEHISGKNVTLAALRGRPALVTFWASWCEPCEQEAPALERFSRNLQGRATLVGVNWEDLSIGNARSFIREHGWTFPNMRDPDGTVGREYGIATSLPTTFVLDSAGRLRMTLRGPQTELTLSKALASVSG
jgi:cytochrome c biogenesis protein CcmG/thiol:disulfide interchange protein DsbE